MKRRKIPWFWRRQMSCPDCGFVYKDEATVESAVTAKDKDFNPLALTCPRCKAHYTWDDFWELGHEKYSMKAEL